MRGITYECSVTNYDRTEPLPVQVLVCWNITKRFSLIWLIQPLRYDLLKIGLHNFPFVIAFSFWRLIITSKSFTYKSHLNKVNSSVVSVTIYLLCYRYRLRSDRVIIPCLFFNRPNSNQCSNNFYLFYLNTLSLFYSFLFFSFLSISLKYKRINVVLLLFLCWLKRSHGKRLTLSLKYIKMRSF